jgi:hypothetical protein
MLHKETRTHPELKDKLCQPTKSNVHFAAIAMTVAATQCNITTNLQNSRLHV